MTTTFGSNITIDGSLNNAVAASPAMQAKFTRKLPVPWNPDRYEDVVVHHLRTLRGSTVGNAVLGQLTQPLRIRPWIWEPANAAAIPLAALHATERDSPVPESTHVRGTGRGTPVTIWFKPANRAIPDATLLHESVHALRMMNGALTGYEYGNSFHREEEYFAILVTNVFQSELKRTLIRIDHTGKSWVDAKSPWDQFRIDPFLITAFEMRHPTLSMDIGRSKAAFNPFSPHFSDKVRAH
jgi:hypothetical protein